MAPTRTNKSEHRIGKIVNIESNRGHRSMAETPPASTLRCGSLTLPSGGTFETGALTHTPNESPVGALQQVRNPGHDDYRAGGLGESTWSVPHYNSYYW